jgi:hypothetical protein
MSKRSSVITITASALVLAALVMRAVTVHSVGAVPEIYRVTANNNDLEGVEGIAPPGRLVELWYKQRTFREGAAEGDDLFSWCGWKNGGNAVYLGAAYADSDGVFRFQNLRRQFTVMIFPPAAASGTCTGGVFTQLLPRACDSPGVNCTAFTVPTLHWLNVKKQSGGSTGTAAGGVSGAETAAIAVADGPNDGPEPSDVNDVDSNGIDTRHAGLTWGQKITWKCGAGGTAVCPSVAIHDASTVTDTDPEYPYLLGTMQAHRPGGSFFAAAAVSRGQDLGCTANVNVKFRGLLDINLGCDQQQFFDFSVPFNF